MDVTPEEVERVMQEHNINTLIHGHTHRPAIHNLTVNNKAAQRVVLGDWHNKGWEVVIDKKPNKNEITLHEFPIELEQQ